MRRILHLLLTFVVIFGFIVWFYVNYQDDIYSYLADDQVYVIYIESAPLYVTVANDPEEQRVGLSGTPSLPVNAGKLFIFDKEDYYGMWMKDMLFPIDILWIDNNFKIVHIEENVTPETYPDTFSSDVPARFVLETNAFFAKNSNVIVGDEVDFAARLIPKDLSYLLR
jgi:uncharacterized membrane protein (UPF0127 family)